MQLIAVAALLALSGQPWRGGEGPGHLVAALEAPLGSQGGLVNAMGDSISSGGGVSEHKQVCFTNTRQANTS